MRLLAARHIILFSVIGLVVGCLAVLGIFNYGRIVEALTPKPETFTELYFERHLNLPKSMSFNVPQSFQFSVHNVEGKPMDYPFVVNVDYEGEYPLRVQLMNESIHLEPDEKKIITVDFKLPEIYANRAKFSVNLTDLNQSIHFYVSLINIDPAPNWSPSPIPN